MRGEKEWRLGFAHAASGPTGEYPDFVWGKHFPRGKARGADLSPLPLFSTPLPV